MTEHVHEWAFSIYFPHIYCNVKGCNETMAVLEAEARLNATSRLPADEHFRWFADMVEQAPNLDEIEQKSWSGALRAYADILEGK